MQHAKEVSKAIAAVLAEKGHLATDTSQRRAQVAKAIEKELADIEDFQARQQATTAEPSPLATPRSKNPLAF